MTEFWRSRDMPQLESRRSCQAVSCYRPHTHDRFSIGLIDAGQAVFAGSGDTRCELEPGDVLLIPAHTVHSCNRQSGLWTYQMIHLDQDWIAGLLPDGAAQLFDGVAVFREPGLHGAFNRLNDALFRGDDPAGVQARLVEALSACLDLAPSYRGAPSPEPSVHPSLAPVLDRLRSDAPTPSLDELAGLLGGGFAGAYTLGMFTRRANSQGVAIGIASSMVLTLGIWSLKIVHPYFYLAISILLCIVIGYLASLLFPPPARSLTGLTIYRD